jgi:hypothetical protein
MNPTPYYEYILVKIYKENDLNAIHIREEELSCLCGGHNHKP